MLFLLAFLSESYQCLYHKHYWNHLFQPKAYFTQSDQNQLSNFSKNWWMQRSKSEFQKSAQLGTGLLYHIAMQ